MIVSSRLELAIFAIAKCRHFVDFPCWDTNSVKYLDTQAAVQDCEDLIKSLFSPGRYAIKARGKIYQVIVGDRVSVTEN